VVARAGTCVTGAGAGAGALCGKARSPASRRDSSPGRQAAPACVPVSFCCVLYWWDVVL
jgi:hypothetical protein